jgi:hypothetical protein
LREFERLGDPISEQDQTESSTEQNDGTAASTNIYIITATATTALVAATLLIYFRKTRKTIEKTEVIMPEESV